jgi:hypothetical protein
MQWFRAKRPHIAYVALLALALQAAITFGHVHVADAENAVATNAAAQFPSNPGNPNGTAPERDEGCAICAIVGLSASLIIPDAPALVFIGAQHEVLFDDAAVISVPARGRAAFQARAPPA